MSARDDILGRLRRAGFTAGVPQVPAGEAGAVGGTVPAPVDRFIERARAAGVEVTRVAEFATLAEQVRETLAAAGARTAVIWESELLRPVEDALRRSDVRITDDPSQADAGITMAEAAVAETGTLVLGAGPGRARGVSLIPPLHIAVLPEDLIVSTLFDLFPRLEGLPSALSFITGPSRTADIEHTPVRGAHGPIAVSVFLVRI